MCTRMIGTLLAIAIPVATAPYLVASPQDDPKGSAQPPGNETAPPPGPARPLGQALLEAAEQRSDAADGVGASGRISFEAYGIDFGPWIRRFTATVRRNWFIPPSASTKSGHSVVTFGISKDGMISNIKIVEPSGVAEFDRAAFNAIVGSNPLEALPDGYPKEEMVMTVTFYYNEQPPATPAKDGTSVPNAK